MLDRFSGIWKISEGKNLSEFLKAIGARSDLVTAGDNTQPTLYIFQRDGSKMKVDVANGLPTFYNVHIKFNLGQAFDDPISDGRSSVKTVVTFEDNKLIYKQKWEDKKAEVIREIVDGFLVATLKCGDVVAHRKYYKEGDIPESHFDTPGFCA